MARWLGFILAVLLATKASAEGGETIEAATVIPSLPYFDNGSTCGHSDDYDVACPNASVSPDVVYTVTPAVDRIAYFDLCGSTYDSKIYIYAGDGSTLVACDDDGCGLETQAGIGHLPIVGGETYYVVVDGSESQCGYYELYVYTDVPCVVDCPPGAMVEGEPPCADGYVDHYNAGCWGGGWIPIYGGEDGCAEVCGNACIFDLNGQLWRDTDWYTVRATGPVTVSFEAEFVVSAFIIYRLDCLYPEYVFRTTSPCDTDHVSWAAEPGEELWLRIYPSEEEELSERAYVMRVCGIAGSPTPVEKSTWGRIKSRYRLE